MALTGDFFGLKRLERNLRELAKVPSQAARLAATKIDALVREEYDQGANAYGQAWAKLAPSTIAKGRFPPPLTDTRAMRDGTTVTPTSGAGITVRFAAPYSTFHHTGFRVGQTNVPARPVAPTGAGLPPSWQLALKSACAEATAARMGAK